MEFPNFGCPKAIVEAEVDYLRRLGVDLQLNQVIGNSIDVDELLNGEGFDAAFIGVGAGLPTFMGVPGENLGGVYSANEYLTRSNLMKAYDFPNYDTPVVRGRNVCVVGGGNVAMDAARTARRLGGENVYILYRRSLDEMPARAEEIHHARQEGIIFKLLCARWNTSATSKAWFAGSAARKWNWASRTTRGAAGRSPSKVRNSFSIPTW